MSKNFFIADWHYGQQRILGKESRPFISLSDMNKELIVRWNDVVSEEDTVYILGDMFDCPLDEAISVVEQLKGRRVLVTGCNESNTKFDSTLFILFDEVTQYSEIEDGIYDVVLSHYPMLLWNNCTQCISVHLYGHVHKGWEYSLIESARRALNFRGGLNCKMINVGADLPYMNFTPRTLEELLSKKSSKFSIKKYLEGGIFMNRNVVVAICVGVIGVLAILFSVKGKE